MCTAVTMRSQRGDPFFARTLDFSYHIEPSIYFIPKNSGWQNAADTIPFVNRYAFLGIGQRTQDLLGFFDGVNELGVAGASLYFAGSAQYDTYGERPGKQHIASIDVLHYLLGNAASVADIPALLADLSVVGITDSITNTAAPLHWIMTDTTGNCVVIEPTAAGLLVYDNPLGVMANSPDFPWHLTNLRNYSVVAPDHPRETQWGDILLLPFGQAAGTTGLPGGFTSPERFVRMSYIKTHVAIPRDKNDTIATCFHCMENVFIPKGIALTERGTCDYTKYVAVISLTTGEYFFTIYNSMNLLSTGPLKAYLSYSKPVNLGRLSQFPIR